MTKFIKIAIIATSMLALGAVAAEAKKIKNSAFAASGVITVVGAGHGGAGGLNASGSVASTNGNGSAQAGSLGGGVADSSHHGSFAAVGGGSFAAASSGSCGCND